MSDQTQIANNNNNNNNKPLQQGFRVYIHVRIELKSRVGKIHI